MENENRTYDASGTDDTRPKFWRSSMSDRITIRLDERMREIVHGLALAERKSASQVVRDALYDYLKAIESRD